MRHWKVEGTQFKPRGSRVQGSEPKYQVVVSDAALFSLIENYCREAGVRNLQKHIEKIYGKIALKLVRGRASVEAPAVSVDDTKRMKLVDIMKILESTTLDSIKSKTKQSGVVVEKVI